VSQKLFEQHVDALAQYMPNGRLFEAKHISDSNFRQLLRGLCGELFDAQGYILRLEGQYFPQETEDFISEWESALGIPDETFSGTGSVQERRRDIVVKLAGLGVQTAADFEELAALFGEDVTVIPGSEYTGYGADEPADDQKRYIVVAETPQTGSGFPYTLPFALSSNALTVLESILLRLIPANCNVLFTKEPLPPGPGEYLLQSYFDELDEDSSGVLLSGTSGKLLLSST